LHSKNPRSLAKERIYSAVVTITPHMLHITWEEIKHYFDGKQGHKHCSHWESIRTSKTLSFSKFYIRRGLWFLHIPWLTVSWNVGGSFPVTVST